MIGDRPNKTIVKPLRRPMATPTKSARGTTQTAAASAPLVNVVTTIAENVIVQGTDRASPPEMTTVPCPKPRIARKDV